MSAPDARRPVRPRGRAAAGNAAARGLADLAWLTWRQHRTVLIAWHPPRRRRHRFHALRRRAHHRD